MGGTLVLMSKFYAPYFFTNVDLSPLQELARGQVVSAVRDVAHKLLDALRTVPKCWPTSWQTAAGDSTCCFSCCWA